jgi:hypothetical protein
VLSYTGSDFFGNITYIPYFFKIAVINRILKISQIFYKLTSINLQKTFKICIKKYPERISKIGGNSYSKSFFEHIILSLLPCLLINVFTPELYLF